MARQSPIFHCLSEIQRLSRESKTRTGSNHVSEGYALTQEMLDRITNLSEQDRNDTITNLSREESGFLHGIARGRAIKAVREINHDDLRYGLTALILENQWDDWRETLVKLCLLNHSAEKLGVNLESIYQRIRHLATEPTAKLMDAYFQDGERDIGAMGYMEDTSSDGFIYTRTW